MGKQVVIRIDSNLHRVLELEKTFNRHKSLEDVIRANMDVDRMERRFSRLLKIFD